MTEASPTGSTVEVTDLTFTVKGDQCRAWLYRPAGTAEPAPVVVFAHGFSGTNALHYGMRARAYASRGLAVLDFDPRHLGASEGQPRQIVDWRRQVEDVAAAVAFASKLPAVDRTRVALFGSSMGGGVMIDVASRNADIAALVVTVPHVDGLTNLPGSSLASKLRLTATGVADRLGRLVGRPPRTVRVFGTATDHCVIDRDGILGILPLVVEPSSTWDDAMTVLTAERSGYRNEATAWETLLRRRADR